MLSSVLFQIYVIDSADRKRFEETGQVRRAAANYLLVW